MLDAMTLLYNVYRGNASSEVGYEDCNQPLKTLVANFSKRRVDVKQDDLESALWSGNLLDEQALLTGGFWSPTGESFDEFVRRLLKSSGHPDASFNKDYNQITKQQKNP
jgi:hypothetical protein